MIKYRSIFLFLFTCTWVITYAQVSFFRIFGSNEQDIPYKMIEDDEGDFVISGDFTNNHLPPWKCGAFVLKINTQGDSLWKSEYNCYSTFSDIIQPNGTLSGYYIGGEGANNRESSPRFSFINKNQQVIFDSIQDLPIPKTGGVYSMCVNYKDGIIVSSSAGTPYYMNGDQCLYVQANTMNGKRLWYKYICDGNLFGYRIFWNEVINQYITFCRDGDHKLIVVRTDSIGNSIEIKQPFKGLELDDAIKLKNGNYLVTVHNIQTMYLGLLSSTGDSLNLIQPAQGSNESPYQHVAQCKDGGFIFSGIEKLVRTDSVFQVIWVKTIPDVEFMSVCETKDGGYAAVGDLWIKNDSTNWDDIYVIKTDSLGRVTGVKEPAIQKPSIHIYPNPANDLVQIQSSVPFAAVAVTNAMGQMILKLNEEVSSFNSSTIPSGIYFITLTDKQGSILHQQKISILHE